MAWYFEEYLEFPFTKQVRFRQAAESIERYGETLFGQVFSGSVLAEYYPARAGGVANLHFEIVPMKSIGSFCRHITMMVLSPT